MLGFNTASHDRAMAMINFSLDDKKLTKAEKLREKAETLINNVKQDSKKDSKILKKAKKELIEGLDYVADVEHLLTRFEVKKNMPGLDWNDPEMFDKLIAHKKRSIRVNKVDYEIAHTLIKELLKYLESNIALNKKSVKGVDTQIEMIEVIENRLQNTIQNSLPVILPIVAKKLQKKHKLDIKIDELFVTSEGDLQLKPEEVPATVEEDTAPEVVLDSESLTIETVVTETFTEEDISVLEANINKPASTVKVQQLAAKHPTRKKRK